VALNERDGPGTVRPVSDEERRRFAVPPAEGVVDDIDLALLDPADEDDRRLLIEAEHPEFRRAIEDGRREVHLGGEAVNPVLHITMHEIVANQLWKGEPPEVWDTAQRLLADGYERHEVLHMLASVVAGKVFEVMRDDRPPDPARLHERLAALPGAWEQRRADIPAERHQNRAERRAAARKHRR